MKRIMLLVASLYISMNAYSQFEKGNMLVGGSLGANISSNRTKNGGNSTLNSRSSNFSFSPQFGVFIIDNLAIGGGMGLSTGSTKADDSSFKSTSHEVTIEPMARYYFQKGIFLQGKFIFGNARTKETNDGGSNTDITMYNVSGWSMSAGYAYFINNHVAIEPQLGYGAKGYKNRESDNKSVDGGLFLRVGFQIYLRK